MNEPVASPGAAQRGYRTLRRLLVWLSLAVLPLFVFGQLSPDLQKALDWLSAQVSAARVIGEDGSVALPSQVRLETAETLRALAALPAPLITAVADEIGDAIDTETLSRKVIASARLGRNLDGLLDQLRARQNPDGGFGAAPGYQSHALDTAWAVLAIAQGGQGASDAARRGRAYLSSLISGDGIVRADPGQREQAGARRLYVSAIGSLALQTGTEPDSAQGVQTFTQGLVNAQGADGGWGGDTLLSAWVLQALAPVSSDAGMKAAAQTFLRSRQAVDGSWNGDPYITAIALRVLGASATPVGGTGSSAIVGTVVDAVSGLALSDASISAAATAGGAGAPTATVTDAQGGFRLPGLVAGGYTITVSRAGYQSLASGVSLAAAQTASFGEIRLQPNAASGIVRGTVTEHPGGALLPGVQITVQTAAGSNVVNTDAQGRYEFSTVAPGPIQLRAALAGFQSLTAEASVLAGRTLVFSPAMTRLGQPSPTTGEFFGQVVNAAANSPLAGVSVVLSNTTSGTSSTLATGPDGRFATTLPPATYVARYELANFTPAEQRFTLVAGSRVDAGVVGLRAARTTSLVTGKVLAADGSPLAGGVVSVVGASPAISARSAADGGYRLDNLAGSSVVLRAAASGFNAQTVSLSSTVPSEMSFDFRLSPQGSGLALAIEPFTLAPTTVPAATVVRGSAAVKNQAAAGSAVLSASFDVFDAADRIVASVAATDESGLPLGDFEVPAGASRSFGLLWNSSQFPPGTYRVMARIVEPGSRSATLPAGQVLVERAASLQIDPTLSIAGSVMANPPVVRAGIGAQIALSAVLRNTGNDALPPGSYRLEVVRKTTGIVAVTRDAAGSSTPVSGLLALDFGGWTAEQGGDYEVRVRAVDSAVTGAATTPLFVGDSGSGAFTVDKGSVATGTQRVRATIRVTGQDSANGTISDPLAPLIRGAITKAVNYADGFASAHYVNDLRCFACHVQTQALVGGEHSRRFAPPLQPLQRATLFNGMTQYQASNGQVDGAGYPLANSSLSLWAALAWHKPDAHALTKTRLADYLLTRQVGGGEWQVDHVASWWGAGWSPLTSLNLQSFIKLHQRLSAAPQSPNLLNNLQPWTVPGLPNGDMRFSAAPDGTLYLTNASTAEVWRVAADRSSVTRLVTGVPVTGLHWMDGDRLLITARNGVYLRENSGELRRLATTDAWDAIPWEDGYLVSPWGGSTIYRMTQAGALTPVFSSPLLANSSGSMVPQQDGSIAINAYGGLRVLRFKPDGSGLVDVPVPLMSSNPQNVLRFGSGHLVSSENGLYYFDEDWLGERLTFERTFGTVVMPDGRLLVNFRSGVYELKTAALDRAALLGRLNTSIDRATQRLTMPSGIADANDNVQVAFQLMGLGSARQYFAGTARETTLQGNIESLAATLRSRQRADGGWGRYNNTAASDSLVTAMVGVALDVLNPSPSAPEVRKAIQFVLSRQQADGTWRSEAAGLGSPPLLATTWVEIWLPVMLDRLGGIDTDLIVDLPATAQASNFSLAPTAIDPLGDGGQRLRWRMLGVTSLSRALDFDLELADLAPGEERPAATKAELIFNNTFTGEPVSLPLVVPVVRASAGLGVTVATDAASYGAEAPVLVTAKVSNTGLLAADASVRLSVRAPDGAELADLGTHGLAGLAAGETRTVSALWGTGVRPAAPGYAAQAELADGRGRAAGQAQAPFAIVAGVSQVAARIASDRPSYAPTDLVTLTDRITNTVANSVVQDLSARTTVKDAGGALVWTRTEPLAQLAAGAQKELAYAVNLNAASAGRYQADLVVLDAAGALRASATTAFDVRDSGVTGDGLGGTLKATPKSVVKDEAVALDWGITNRGNRAFAALPVRLRVLDPAAAGAVLAELSHSLPLALGQTQAMAQSWTPTSAQVGKTLLAVLEAEVSGQWLPLAQDSFSVKAAAAAVQAVAEARREARVLALVSCPAGSDGGAQGQPVAGGEATCAAQRAAGFSQSLASLGIVHKAVTSRAEFESELRCGAYNTYWISGGSAKLSDEVAREVAEAVRRGDALVLDGESDIRDAALLHSLAGVTRQAKLGTADQAITFGGTTEFPAGTLATLGWPTKYVAQATAQVHAAFGDGSAALVTQRHGLGRSVVLAFELARMLKQSPADAAQQALVQRVLEMAAGAGSQVPVGAPVAVALKLSNTGQQAATVQVQAQLPAGLKPLEVNQALSWQVPLAAGQEHVLVLRLQAAEAGAQALEFTVTAGGQGNTVTHQVQVQALQQLAEQASAQVQALNPAAAEEQAAKTRALQAITQAQALNSQQKHDEALSQWLQAVVELQRIGGDAQTAALAVAQALQGAERALCPQLACLSGTVQIRAGTQPVTQLAVNAAATLQRQVANSCQAALPEWQITAQLTNRRTAQTLLQLQGDVSLPAGQGNEQQGGFTAAGQSGDTLEALLYGQRLGLQQYLGRATVVLTAPLVCDVDVNGAVNTTDLELIRQAIGKSVPAGDSRDADGNKLITINDVRACTAKCTKPNCAL